MAYFKIEEPNKPTKWIDTVDRANGKLTFRDNRGGYEESSGYFANSALKHLQFHFMEEYPELKYMKVDTSGGGW